MPGAPIGGTDSPHTASSSTASASSFRLSVIAVESVADLTPRFCSMTATIARNWLPASTAVPARPCTSDSSRSNSSSSSVAALSVTALSALTSAAVVVASKSAVSVYARLTASLSCSCSSPSSSGVSVPLRSFSVCAGRRRQQRAAAASEHGPRRAATRNVAARARTEAMACTRASTADGSPRLAALVRASSMRSFSVDAFTAVSGRTVTVVGGEETESKLATHAPQARTATTSARMTTPPLCHCAARYLRS